MEETAVSKVARGSALLVAGQMVSDIIATVAFMFIARALTKQEMGLASVVFFTSALGIIISGAGVPTTIVRFISEARGREEDYRPFIMAGVMGQAILASLCSLVMVTMAGELSEVLMGSQGHEVLFYLAALNTILSGFNILLSSILVGLEMMDGVCVAYIASALVACPVSVMLILNGWGVMGYVSLWILNGLVGVLVLSFYLLSALRTRPGAVKEVVSSLRVLLKFSWPILITNLANYSFRFFDKYILAFLGSKEELGVYSVAFKAYTAITMIPLNIAMAIFPYYGVKYGRDDLAAIRQSTFLVSKYLSLLFVPVALGLAVVAEPVLVFFAGAKYAGGAKTLMILGFFGALTAPTPLLGFLLITYKRAKTYMVANLASVGASLALMPLFVPSLGVLLGTALARGLAMVFLLIFYTATTRDLALLDWPSLARGLVAGLIMASAVYGVQAWLSNQPIFLPIYVALGALVYGACIRLLRALNDRDVVLLSNAFPKNMRGLVLALGRLLAFKEES